jgi:hypothetical protein
MKHYKTGKNSEKPVLATNCGQYLEEAISFRTVKDMCRF